MRGRTIASIGAVITAIAGGTVVAVQGQDRTLRVNAPDAAEVNFPFRASAAYYRGDRVVALATVQQTRWMSGDIASLEPTGIGSWYPRRVGVVELCAAVGADTACKFVRLTPPKNYPKVWIASTPYTREDSIQRAAQDTTGGCAKGSFGKFLRQSNDTAFFYYKSTYTAGVDTVWPHYCIPYNLYMAVYVDSAHGEPNPRIFYPDPHPMRPGYKPYGENWLADTAFVRTGRRHPYGGG